MTEKHRDEKQIFLAALEKSGSQERDVFIESECAGDSELLDRVKVLLNSHNESQGPLDAPPPGINATIDMPPVTEKPGDTIGPYKLLQQIGEGGMGVVYMAEQKEPVRRKVALKIIKPGMDTKQVVARFEAERQALAMMDHPNIARVLDGGSTDSGRPFFVMELVKGVPITQYCDEQRLATRQRLDLFITVCHAVQHAHQKGIIHRDLKPSNILIAQYDDQPVAKVIDFGVAKATNQQLTEKTLFTEYGQIVGTLEYMSPEQAKVNQLDIDTRSDVYSLGVLLYELLTGETPFDKKRLRAAAYEEMLQILREEEPPKPSTRLSSSETLPTIATNRQTEPHKLSALIRGELDWIVMKALEKDRTRRYETATNFAADIGRFLNDEPVEACPPSATYRFRKFARRNKATITTASVIAAALILGIIGTTWQAVKASKERQHALDAAQIATEQTERAVNAEQNSRHAKQDAEVARDNEKRQRQQAETNLYESLTREVQALRLARVAGYREQAWKLLDQARHLDTPNRDIDQLRQAAVLCLGDFAGHSPKILKFSQEIVDAVALNRKATIVAVGLRSHDVVLYSLELQKEIARLQGHDDSVCFAQFGNTGSLLVTGDRDGKVCVWKPNVSGQWKCANSFSLEHGKKYLPFQVRHPLTGGLTPDGTHLAACFYGNQETVLIDLASGLVNARFSVDPMTVGNYVNFSRRGLRAATLSANGKLLAATAGTDVFVWDVKSGEIKCALNLRLGVSACVAFSPDGKYLACGSEEGLKVLNTTDYLPSLTIKGEIANSISFSPDSRSVAYSVQASSSTRVWDIVSSRPVVDLESSDQSIVRKISFSAGFPILAVTTSHSVSIWNTYRTPEKLTLAGHSGGVPGIAFSPSGALLASSSKDRTVRIWDPRTGELRRTLTDFSGPVQAVSFSPNGRLLAAVDWGHTLSIWDTSSWRRRIRLKLKVFPWSLAFSQNARQIAVSGNGGIAIWKLGQLEKEASDVSEQALELDKHIKSGNTRSICFSPDGKLLAGIVTTDTFQVHIWDVATGEELKTPPTEVKHNQFNIAFFPDSSHFVYITRHGSLNVWNVKKESTIFNMAQGAIRLLSLSNDGRLAATSTTSKEVSIWNIETRSQLVALPRERGLLWCAAWSPDRQRLALGLNNGEVVIWNIPAIRAELARIGLEWPELPSPFHPITIGN